MFCSLHRGDCDDDPLNGCEASFASENTCGGCASACDPDQKCVKPQNSNFYQCL
jgi:hypothetical protein